MPDDDPRDQVADHLTREMKQLYQTQLMEDAGFSTSLSQQQQNWAKINAPVSPNPPAPNHRAANQEQFENLVRSMLAGYSTGTVIRWKTIHSRVQQRTGPARSYDYAAIFANGMWYLTGRGEWYGRESLATDELFTVLTRAEVREVSLLTRDRSVNR